MRSSNYHEPLIQNQHRSTAIRHGGRRIREIELPSRRQSYEPPSQQATTEYDDSSNISVAVHGGHPVTQPPRRHGDSQGRVKFPNHQKNRHSHHRQVQIPFPNAVQHHYHHSSRSHLRNDNPAQNLSWNILSHGICCLQCVRTQEIGIVERFGAFQEIIGPGLYCGGCWPCTVIEARLSLKVQQIDVHVETKTSDNVFIHILVSVQFRVLVERAYDAYYRLSDASLQIRTHVYDVIRSTVPRMDLDQVFASKTHIADTVFTNLQNVMKHFGYEIVSTLVARVSPNDLVKDSMNEINASKRMRDAVPFKAEAEKISKVKAAEAEAERLYLEGVGIAKQRSAIAKGIQSAALLDKGSTSHATSASTTTTREIMDLILISQYLDMLVAVGADDLLLRTPPNKILEIQQSLPHHHSEREQPQQDLLAERRLQ